MFSHRPRGLEILDWRLKVARRMTASIIGRFVVRECREVGAVGVGCPGGDVVKTRRGTQLPRQEHTLFVGRWEHNCGAAAMIGLISMWIHLRHPVSHFGLYENLCDRLEILGTKVANKLPLRTGTRAISC